MSKFIPGCTSKIPYTSEEEARTFIRTAKHMTKSQYVYHCKNCGHWHTTKMSKTVYKKSVQKFEEDREIKEVTLEDLVDSAIKAQAIIEETEAGLKMVKDELGDRLRAMKVNGTKVRDYFVGRRKLVTFPDVTMSQATELGATTTKIDSNKLRSLYDKGIKLKARITEFVTIKEIKE